MDFFEGMPDVGLFLEWVGEHLGIMIEAEYQITNLQHCYRNGASISLNIEIAGFYINKKTLFQITNIEILERIFL